MSAESSNQLVRETFTGLAEKAFELVSSELQGFSFELREVNKLSGDSDTREPFSIVLIGPLQPILAQSIYRLRNAELGELDLFLVPVGPDRENTGIQYEAVFS